MSRKKKKSMHKSGLDTFKIIFITFLTLFSFKNIENITFSATFKSIFLFAKAEKKYYEKFPVNCRKCFSYLSPKNTMHTEQEQ